MKARQPGQHLWRSGVDGDVLRAALQQGQGLRRQVPWLHEKGHRHTAALQRPPDDQRAFGDKEGVGGVCPVDQLVFRQTGVDVQLRGVEIGDGDDVGHGCLLRFFSIVAVKGRCVNGILTFHRQNGMIQGEFTT